MVEMSEFNIMEIVIKNESCQETLTTEPTTIKCEKLDDDTKPLIKSSAEILSELFSSFNAKPPELQDENYEPSHKRHAKKSKKKHKKKHKKKRKRNDYSSDYSSEDETKSEKSKRKSKKHKKTKSIADYSNESQGSELGLSPPLKAVDSPSNVSDLEIPFHSSDDVPDIDIKTELPKEGAGNEVSSPKEQLEKDVTSTGSTFSKRLHTSTAKSKIDKPTIKIQDLMFSSTISKAIENPEYNREDDGDLSESDELNLVESTDEDDTVSKKKRSKRKHSHDEKKEKHSKRRRSHDKYKSNVESSSKTDKDSHRYRSRSNNHDHREHSFDQTYSKDRRQESSRPYKSIKDRLGYHREYTRDHHTRKHRSESHERSYKSRSPSRSRFDKKKLLEIARKNAIIMLKNGSLPAAVNLGPQAQEKVLAAIKAGGKTIDELTDFCKNLSRKEALGELSSVSSGEDLDNSDSDTEKPFNHPFQIKERPTSIVMNIPNSTVIPVKTLQEKTIDKSVLLMQFPVSSGQQHRKTENEWIPVSPKKTEIPPPVKAKASRSQPTTTNVLLAIPPPPKTPQHTVNLPQLPPAPIVPPLPIMPPPPPPPQVFVNNQGSENLDIGSIVSQRLMAMRKLQENPNDVQAISEMYRAQQEMQSWATSKQTPGQFTGSTGAQILSAAELASGYQAWARKDQLQTAAPLSGGMGMHLLQKMGWRPGEGLGKEKNGALQPLMLEVKLDKKGLVANEEVKNKRTQPIKRVVPVKTLEGKHPVSLLGEFASKRKMGVPQYELCFECGPSHKKNFLFKVKLNGMEYQPSVASPNKKQAKADAATVCLQQLGVLPS